MRGPRWLWERLAGWARRAAAAALASRPVPRHVAFIMDGNRRFAEARSLRKVDGHAFGYQRLLDALEWCLDLGVRCVSVYAFSIDNYRRSGEEVDTLMRLAEEKLALMVQEQDVLVRHGVRVQVIGDLSLAPAAVRAAAERVMSATARHDRAVLNLCFSYTASEELQRALDQLGQQAACRGPGSSSGAGAAVSSSSGSSGGATVAALEQELYTAGCPPVDLLVRTSGETRLSDFLLWQCRHALLVFTQVLWPEFGFLDLVRAIQQYQQQYHHLQQLRAAADSQAAAAAAAGTQAAAGGGIHLRAAALPAGAPGTTQLLPAVKVAGLGAQRLAGSPCSIASPASPSSPSSQSEASAEEASALAAAAPVAAAPAGVRHRHAAAGGAAAQQQCRAPLVAAPW